MTINNNLSNTLNFLRWFAAFLVVLEHLRSLLFLNYINVNEKTLITKIFYFFTGFGHEAVIVFFILSGFLVGGEFLKYEKTLKNIKIYLIKRFSRIYIVFFPALVIGLLFDLIGSTYFNYSLLYNNHFNIAVLNYDVINRLTFDTLISNIFMMQTSITPTLGSNGPLWSLANEWWYYMFLPLIFFSLFHKNIMVKLFSIFCLIILGIVLKNSIILYFLIWAMGLFLYKFSYKINIPYSFILSLILIFVSFSSSRLDFLKNQVIADILIALSIVFLINVLIHENEKSTYFPKFNHSFAEFSYSLYLFHFPLLTLFTAIILTTKFELYSQPSIIHYLLFVCLLLIIYLFSYLMYQIFEKNTAKFKNKLTKWI